MVQTSLAAWLKKPLAKAAAATTKEISKPEPPLKDQPLEHGPEEHDKEEQGENPKGMGENGTANTGTTSAITRNIANLPPNASLAFITAETLPAFRRMTTLLLPVPYPDKFYNEILTNDIAASISLVALWDDRVVAGIRCRLISHPAGMHPAPSLYISTLTTLAPFRNHGLARALLRCITTVAIREYEIGTVTAHNWEGHEEAGQWYEKMGFRRVRFEEGYYRKLKPSGAWLFERKVGPGDLLGEGV
jgi:ribosomal protein S18 acetylase RimI-like enzyme